MENKLTPADIWNVKRVALAILLVVVPLLPAAGWRILYAEQYYKLYHETLHHYPEDTMEDIEYLELALKADFAPFANPLYALATVHNQTEWARYRYLFSMHVNLKLIYLYLTLGSKYDKMVAYFYNYPWKRQNLESLDTAERIYRVANGYWTNAQKWSAMAWDMQDVHLPEIQEWEDENFRVQTGDLDYKQIIDAQLARLEKVRADFQKMDQHTY